MLRTGENPFPKPCVGRSSRPGGTTPNRTGVRFFVAPRLLVLWGVLLSVAMSVTLKFINHLAAFPKGQPLLNNQAQCDPELLDFLGCDLRSWIMPLSHRSPLTDQIC